jgi:hypothetical protein
MNVIDKKINLKNDRSDNKKIRCLKVIIKKRIKLKK